VIDFSSRCTALKSVDVAARTCEVEPGITIDDLNEQLAKHGLFFAPDPATTRQCNVGGAIGNNAAGARSVMFGRTSENLAAVDAAVVRAGTVRRVRFEKGAAGRDELARELTLRVAEVVERNAASIRERFPKTIRRNAGYGLDMVLAQMDERAGMRTACRSLMPSIWRTSCAEAKGTLAITLGATLKLQPLPKAKGLAVIGLGSLEDAVELVLPILGH
jgi:FAD/FMN-containing dehydrogenase